MTKTVAVINDLSGLGRCSLTAAIAVLSALGVQPCPVPTAVLTAQTGFDGFSLHDLTNSINDFIWHWKQLELHFDGISTGFLSSPEQADGVLRFLDAFNTPETLVLTDPVMGDDGIIYPGYTPELRARVSDLVRRADMVTPNLTEACLLAGASYRDVTALSGDALFSAVEEIAKGITALGPDTVVVTGIRKQGQIYNIALDKNGIHQVGAELLGGSYSGTGDLFAAVLHGCRIRGGSIQAASRLAAEFLSAALRDTVAEGTDRNHGVAFEPHLHLLSKASFL